MTPEEKAQAVIAHVKAAADLRPGDYVTYTAPSKNHFRGVIDQVIPHLNITTFYRVRWDGAPAVDSYLYTRSQLRRV